jgi:hypothetical protein
MCAGQDTPDGTASPEHDEDIATGTSADEDALQAPAMTFVPTRKILPRTYHLGLVESNLSMTGSNLLMAESNLLMAGSNLLMAGSNLLMTESNLLMTGSNVLMAESNLLMTASNLLMAESRLLMTESNLLMAESKFVSGEHRFWKASRQNLPNVHFESWPAGHTTARQSPPAG